MVVKEQLVSGVNNANKQTINVACLKLSNVDGDNLNMGTTLIEDKPEDMLSCHSVSWPPTVVWYVSVWCYGLS